MAAGIITYKSFIIAIIGGIVPALLWLWFWLHEDKRSPEPKGLIAISFFAGMVVVFLVLPLEKFVTLVLPMITDGVGGIATKFSLLAPSSETVQVILWAFIEEITIYATVLLIAFKSRYFDEPIDAVIYLITAALGFAAMENVFYVLKDIVQGGALQAVLGGNLRFIGATILHTVSSGFVGIAVAFSFYKSYPKKVAYVILGLILATLLHSYFNLSIIEANGTLGALLVFSWYWAAIVAIIMLFEVIKRLRAN